MPIRHLVRCALLFALLVCGVRAAFASAPPARSAESANVDEEREIRNTVAGATGTAVALLLVGGVIVSIVRRRRRRQ